MPVHHILHHTDTSFAKNNARNYKIFALVSEVKESSHPPHPQMFYLCLILIGIAFGVSSVDLQSLFVLSAIVDMIMAGLVVLTPQEARNLIHWDLLIVVAAAFGVSQEMTNSGVAEGLAKFLVRCGNGLNIGGTLV